jgi:hypothetical protein
MVASSRLVPEGAGRQDRPLTGLPGRSYAFRPLTLESAATCASPISMNHLMASARVGGSTCLRRLSFGEFRKSAQTILVLNRVDGRDNLADQTERKLGLLIPNLDPQRGIDRRLRTVSGAA